MEKYRYSGCRAPQAPYKPDEDDLMDELARQLISSGNVADSLSRMQQGGMEDEQGRRLPGIEDITDELRKKKQGLEKHSQTASEMLLKMERLEKQLQDSKKSSLKRIDKLLFKEIMGDEAACDLERLDNIPKRLDEAGYVSLTGNNYKLTARGLRKIGQRALHDIFAKLRKTHSGGHHAHLKGAGGLLSTRTKKYEPGDSFYIHPQKTIVNAVFRNPSALPISVKPEDFEVFQREGLERSATVLMLDLSFSMPARGHFEAAKKVAVALDSLIRTQYPKDSLYIVGFSNYARQIKKEDLSCIDWGESDKYTNIQHGLYLARKLLAKETQTNKHIILVTDGEPTAHFEGENRFFYQVPPSPRTIQLTLQEARNCTKERIVINTFMLETSPSLTDFVTKMARINRGRVFFTSNDTLGQYLIVDYISNKKRTITPYLT